jgi:hypothetical protein
VHTFQTEQDHYGGNWVLFTWSSAWCSSSWMLATSFSRVGERLQHSVFTTAFPATGRHKVVAAAGARRLEPRIPGHHCPSDALVGTHNSGGRAMWRPPEFSYSTPFIVLIALLRFYLSLIYTRLGEDLIWYKLVALAGWRLYVDAIGKGRGNGWLEYPNSLHGIR